MRHLCRFWRLVERPARRSLVMLPVQLLTGVAAVGGLVDCTAGVSAGPSSLPSRTEVCSGASSASVLAIWLRHSEKSARHLCVHFLAA